MVEKVWESPEIWRIKVDIPNSPLKNLNSYVVISEGNALVIDTGFNFGKCRKTLFEGLEELKIDFDKTSLFITHLHGDHLGLVEDFIARNCNVYMSEIDYRYYCLISRDLKNFWLDDMFVEEGFPQEIFDSLERNKNGKLYTEDGVFDCIKVNDGMDITIGNVELKCIHTPGHTPGHMMLYIPEAEVLFTGDHILFDISSNIAMWVDMENPLGDYIDSLKKCKELPVKKAFPAHRETTETLYERIDHLLTHHDDRLAEIVDAIKERPGSTAYEVAGAITWSMKGMTWDEAPDSQKWFAMGETLAHLKHLEVTKQVERKKAENRIEYYMC